MEKLDLYDIDFIKKGEIIDRNSPISPNRYRMVVHACIFNSKGEMLIQQRQSFKNTWANLWDISVGGSSQAGENPRQAIYREVKEELGLDINFDGVRPHFTVHFSSGIDHYFLINKDVDISSLTLQYDEVQSAKWATEKEILDMIDSGEFISYHKPLIQTLFSMSKSRGAIRQ